MDLQQNFTCPICLELAKDAVESNCCTKIYCQKCIEDMYKKFGHCPCCRNPSITWHMSKIARKVISQIKVPCEYCQILVESGMMAGHVSKCPKVPINCRICGVSMRQADIVKHTASVHEKEAKEYLVTSILALKNKEGSKIQPVIAKEEEINLFRSVINRNGLLAKLGTTSKYYCGGKLHGKCSCCDGGCGPDNGQNCDACMQLDVKRWNLDKGYLVNTNGYVCQLINANSRPRIICYRVLQRKQGGLFSKAQIIACGPNHPCDNCLQVENSIQIGRYVGLY